MAARPGGAPWLAMALAMAMAAALSCSWTAGVDAAIPLGLSDILNTHIQSTVSVVEFWHKFDYAGYKTVFGEVGAFGEGQVIDYAVLNSADEEIGRAQGIGISDSLQGGGIQELFTDTFTAGEYAGSSVTFGGHWNQTQEQNELPILGGTGLFRFATGTAVFSMEIRDSGVYFHVTGLALNMLKSHLMTK